MDEKLDQSSTKDSFTKEEAESIFKPCPVEEPDPWDDEIITELLKEF